MPAADPTIPNSMIDGRARYSYSDPAIRFADTLFAATERDIAGETCIYFLLGVKETFREAAFLRRGIDDWIVKCRFTHLVKEPIRRSARSSARGFSGFMVRRGTQ
jgi:hypothetical protein